jgi:hypothetical protein
MQTNYLWEAHNQWASRPADQRFETLDALRASVQARRMASRSIDVDIGEVGAKTKEGLLLLGKSRMMAEPSHWALGQFCGFIGAPASYLRTLPQSLVVPCLNYGLQQSKRDELKFMTVEREGVSALQAVTSPSYGRIWDADVVDAAGRIVEKTDGRFHNPKAWKHGIGGEVVGGGLYASDRDVFIFMVDGGSLLDAGPRAQLNRGFFMWNSEVGAKTFGLTTFLFNLVCGNHIIVGAQDVNTVIIRHSKNGPYRFDGEAMPALLEYVNASPKPMEQAIKRAQESRLPHKNGKPTEEEVMEFAVGIAKFTKTEVREGMAAAEKEEGKRETLWDLVQGLSTYARGFDYLDARTDLETRAGKLMSLVMED